MLVQEHWVDWPDAVYDKVGNILLSRLMGADVRLVSPDLTVGRHLNGRPGVNAETMQRVLQVVSEMGSPPLRGRPRRLLGDRQAGLIKSLRQPSGFELHKAVGGLHGKVGPVLLLGGAD